MKILIVESSSVDPWYNLAFEEYLLKFVEKNQIIFYLWQNSPTVVIGRNQNPWQECHCFLLEEEGGHLARRLSGGGAVFQDYGNLNFTFVMDAKLYDFAKQIQIIIQAIKKFDINVKFSGRNDLLAQNKKISGNAYYFTDCSAYHHGTILIDTDLSKLSHYLKVSEDKIMSKGIDSVKSRVENLKNIQPNINVSKMRESLKDAFEKVYGPSAESTQVNGINNINIEHLYNKYASWEWRYGATPEFDIVFQNRFIWGEIEIRLNFQNGYINSAVIYSDAMNSILIREIAALLPGLPFDKRIMLNRIQQIPVEIKDKFIIQDIAKWLNEA